MFRFNLNQQLFAPPSFPGKSPHISKRRSGSILVLVCLAIPMMFGFCALAVDYAVLNLDANRLQRACDAAALAGASMLKKTNDTADVALARTEAINIALKNGVALASSDIAFPTDDVGTVDWSPNSRIRVTGRFTRQLLFAPFFKLNGATLDRHATAQVTSISGLSGVVPLVITTTDYANYSTGGSSAGRELQLALIRMQDGTDFVAGTIAGVSTPDNPDNADNTAWITQTGDNNGKSPSHWGTEILGGTSVQVNIYDNDVSINASLQNQNKVLSDALSERINEAKAAGWDPRPQEETAAYPNYPGSAAQRIFTIAVANPTSAANGNQNIILLKFVKVYLVAYTGRKVTLRLLPNSPLSSEGIDVRQSDGSYVKGTYTNGNGIDSGLSYIRMIDDMPTS